MTIDWAIENYAQNIRQINLNSMNFIGNEKKNEQNNANVSSIGGNWSAINYGI